MYIFKKGEMADSKTTLTAKSEFKISDAKEVAMVICWLTYCVKEIFLFIIVFIRGVNRSVGEFSIKFEWHCMKFTKLSKLYTKSSD